MTVPSEHTPAGVVIHLLIAENLLSIGTEPVEWPGFVGHAPDGPDNCVTGYDSSPEAQGRVLATGYTVRRWGIQLRLRAGQRFYNEGWHKLAELDTYLTNVHNKPVVFEDAVYVVNSISNEGGPMFAGRDEQARRPFFTTNYLCNIRAA